MKQKTNRTQCLEGISLILIFENSNNNEASRGSNKKSRQASKYKAIWIKIREWETMSRDRGKWITSNDIT